MSFFLLKKNTFIPTQQLQYTQKNIWDKALDGFDLPTYFSKIRKRCDTYTLLIQVLKYEQIYPLVSKWMEWL